MEGACHKEYDDGLVVRRTVTDSASSAYCGVTVRYCKGLKRLSTDLPEVIPEEGYDYAVPTYVAHRAKGNEVVGHFADIRSKLDFDYHGCYTTKRQKLQDIFIMDVVGTGTKKDNPWAIFTAGAMGAGKGHVMDWLSQQGHFPLPDVVTVDPDIFRTELPEWNGFLARDPTTAGRKTHRESGYMVEIAQEAAMRMCKNVWIDGSLRDAVWYRGVFDKMRREHRCYQIAIFHVSAPWEIVCERAASRAQKTGRIVPEADLRASFDQVPLSVRQLAQHVDFVAHIENGDLPRLAGISVRGGEPVSSAADWYEVRERFAALPALKHSAKSAKPRLFVDELLRAHPVLVFSKTYCSYCKRVKKVLLEEVELQNFHVVELDTMTVEGDTHGKIEGDAGVVVQLELEKLTGRRLVPQVFIHGQFVGGCSEVLKLHSQGVLKGLIEDPPPPTSAVLSPGEKG